MRNLKILAEYFLIKSWMVTKLPRDLDIFFPLTVRNPECNQYLTIGFLPEIASIWAISASWWGKIKSLPPPCMSYCVPKNFWVIAVSSMCQPGRPRPKGDGQDGSENPAPEPSVRYGASFQRQKSPLFFFSLLSSMREIASSA